jgi:hypothetical protein
VNRRRRLAVLLSGLVAATTMTALPVAQASSPSVQVPARQWGCVWVDLVDKAVCLSN